LCDGGKCHSAFIGVNFAIMVNYKMVNYNYNNLGLLLNVDLIKRITFECCEKSTIYIDE